MALRWLCVDQLGGNVWKKSRNGWKQFVEDQLMRWVLIPCLVDTFPTLLINSFEFCVWLDLNYGERVSFVVSLKSETRHRILSSWLVSEIRAGARLLEIHFNFTWRLILISKVGTLLKIFIFICLMRRPFWETLLLQPKAGRKLNHLNKNDIDSNSLFHSTILSLQP